MKYKQEDKTKIIVLSAILACILVVVIVRWFRLSDEYQRKMLVHQETDHALQQAVAQYSAPNSAAAVLEAGQPPTSPLATALLAEVPPPDRDPFHPIIPPHSRQASSAAAPRQEPSAQSPGSELPFVLTPDGNRQTLHVTGIAGETAVLRHGEDHFIVQAGDFLDNRLRVTEVGRSTVTLQDNQRSYVLRLGG
jgi:type II secretory pathway pseudopilin PulG